jgi:hypothetical protein
VKDLRQEIFASFGWYKQLERAGFEGAPIVKALVARTKPAWWIDLLNVALHYACDKGLLDTYSARLATLRTSEFREDVAIAEGREPDFPLWEILNELIVAAYLEHVLGWRYVSHEPLGATPKRGDWQFVSHSGRTVFVEVKSIAERLPYGDGAFMRGSYASRLRGVLARAYKQLPDDERSTLVVLVADWTLEISHGIFFGDLSAALFGEYVVKFSVMMPKPEVTYAGPSFREMHVTGTKHRRLGAVAGLRVLGQDVPVLHFYAIHNPFCRASHEVPADAFGLATQLRFEGDRGTQVGSLDSHDVWQAILSGLRGADA